MRQKLCGPAAAAVVAVGVSVAAAPLAAQGSSVYTQGACMSGRAGAGIASPCADGSAVFFNPAALAVLPGAVSAGFSAITTENTFTYDDVPALRGLPSAERGPETTLVPHAWLTHRFGERLGVGVGFWAPYGLGLEWPLEFEGRYFGYDQSLQGLYLQPTAAYQVVPGVLSVGAGVDVVRAQLDVRRRVDAPQLGLRGVDIADVELGGDGWGVTGHVGVHVDVAPTFSIGARYMHEVTVDLEGDAVFRQQMTGTPLDAAIGQQFAPGGPFVDQAVATQITLPAQAVVGLSLRPLPGFNLMADYHWMGWSSFDRFDLEFDAAPPEVLVLDYRDSHTWRIGADVGITPALEARAGFIYNFAASPRPTPFLPEGDRNYLALGLGYRITDRLTADAMGQIILQQDRRGAVRPGEGDVGIYTSDAHLLGLTLSYRLGRALPASPPLTF